MAISFDRALGIHEQALLFRSRRAEVLGNNLANADTPNFKARDLDFAAALQSAGNQSLIPARTHSNHMSVQGNVSEAALRYRTPTQPSVDGNTVETQLEYARYAKNALDFQASFQFLNSKFTGLKNAIRGEV